MAVREPTYLAVYAAQAVVFRAPGDASAKRKVEREAKKSELSRSTFVTLFRKLRGEHVYMGTWDLENWTLAETHDDAAEHLLGRA